MLVSYKWLKQLVPLTASATELADKMSLTGIEVEGVTSPSEGLSKIVVGQVLSCEDVPDTHLHLCQVDTGDAEPRQIVCGAPNVRAGIKVMVALPGARIADNYKIKKGKIRGMESLGMICSLGELGISDSVVPKEFSDGIQILPDDAEVGQPVFSYLDLDDEIIELSITPNRADALSMRGVAHEVAAIYGLEPVFEDLIPAEIDKPAADQLEVAIATDKVLTYMARVVEDVTIAPSPQWLQNLLMNQGIRPINNVVDVTNYILLYFGQPMHAFDFDKFDGKAILARQARSGEKLTTLDGVERDLTAEDLVITVDDKPVALAGVMGGQDTEIDKDSKRVVLEAAVFDGKSIRKTSGRLNLRSESSARFEKGINYDTVGAALDMAAAMLADLAGGKVLSGQVTAGSLPTQPVAVSTSLAYVNRRLGTTLTMADVADIFARLGFGFAAEGESFTVLVPRRRWDISLPADLVEEIARIYGYDRLPTTLPETGGTAGELTSMQKLRRKVRRLAEGAGLTEVITYALTTSEKAQAFALNQTPLTELMWPMTTERSVLRQNMVSGILDSLAYNLARQQKNLAVYEVGKTFEATADANELPIEHDSFALALTGLVVDKDFQTPARPVDFYQAKGILDLIFDKLSLTVTYVATAEVASLHPGRAALIYHGEVLLGFVGQVHPQLAKELDLPETYMAEINLSRLEGLLGSSYVFEDISKFPSVTRDVALLLDTKVSHQDIVDVIETLKLNRLVAIKLFDVYAGDKIAADKKSMAYSLTFQNPNESLTDEQVAKDMAKISQALADQLQAEVR